MSIETKASALSMSESLNSLRTTPLVMHRITFKLADTQQWYGIMKEARLAYGKNWTTQPRVKRKLERLRYQTAVPLSVWFDVPDPAFATWCAVKLSVEPVSVVAK